MRKFILSVCASALLVGTAMAQTAPAAPSATMTTPQAVQCVGAEGVVYFGLGSTTLSADSIAALAPIAAARHAECTSQITITGHTDASGSVARNRRLAAQRAAAVKAHLISIGVPQDEILMGGAGESEPQATEDRLNRRVTVALTATPRVAIAPTTTTTTVTTTTH